MCPRLPMELWAHIATFLPEDELLTTFWALRRAGALPWTGTPPANAYLQFASTASLLRLQREERLERQREDAIRYREATLRALLVEMGYDDDVITQALRVTHDLRIEVVLDNL